jgi:hypothetical protein
VVDGISCRNVIVLALISGVGVDLQILFEQIMPLTKQEVPRSGLSVTSRSPTISPQRGSPCDTGGADKSLGRPTS